MNPPPLRGFQDGTVVPEGKIGPVGLFLNDEPSLRGFLGAVEIQGLFPVAVIDVLIFSELHFFLQLNADDLADA